MIYKIRFIFLKKFLIFERPLFILNLLIFVIICYFLKCFIFIFCFGIIFIFIFSVLINYWIKLVKIIPTLWFISIGSIFYYCYKLLHFCIFSFISIIIYIILRPYLLIPFIFLWVFI